MEFHRALVNNDCERVAFRRAPSYLITLLIVSHRALSSKRKRYFSHRSFFTFSIDSSRVVVLLYENSVPPCWKPIHRISFWSDWLPKDDEVRYLQKIWLCDCFKRECETIHHVRGLINRFVDALQRDRLLCVYRFIVYCMWIFIDYGIFIDLLYCILYIDVYKLLYIYCIVYRCL